MKEKGFTERSSERGRGRRRRRRSVCGSSGGPRRRRRRLHCGHNGLLMRRRRRRQLPMLMALLRRAFYPSDQPPLRFPRPQRSPPPRPTPRRLPSQRSQLTSASPSLLQGALPHRRSVSECCKTWPYRRPLIRTQACSAGGKRRRKEEARKEEKRRHYHHLHLWRQTGLLLLLLAPLPHRLAQQRSVF